MIVLVQETNEHLLFQGLWPESGYLRVTIMCLLKRKRKKYTKWKMEMQNVTKFKSVEKFLLFH